MAENKKSFILYADLLHTLIQLPDDKAGKLFKHILQYVNDEDPQTEDMILKIAFEPIKQQLKRDLKRYETKKEQWSKAGKASAAVKKSQRMLTDVEGRSTDSTVNVNANVNDNATSISRDKVIEYLRGAAPISTHRQEIEATADRMIDYYQGQKIGNLRALCNSWAAKISEGATMPEPKPRKREFVP